MVTTAGSGPTIKTVKSKMHQLLFFDTFSHDSLAVAGTGELNLDLVQFPSPVYVSEVRVIPLGSKVKANFPGGVRLGATNPNKFDLEFFVNNLKAPGASTFESIGVLQYNHAGCISLATSQDIATDGLVLRGLYSTITLAVYGTVSDSTPDQLARQGNTVSRPVKEEAGELTLPLGPIVPNTDNGRTLGESYAAQWTEKHSQQALKAEPPDGWGEVVGVAGVAGVTGVTGVKVEVTEEKSNGRYEEGAQYRTKSDRRQTPDRPLSPRDIKREGLSPRDKILSPRQDRGWNRYSEGYRSKSRDRSRNGSRDRGRSPRPRDRSPRERDKSPGGRSDRARTPDRRARTPECRDRDRTPKPRDRSASRDRATRSLSRERTPVRRDRSRTPGLSRQYSKSREASLDKRSFRSVSRDHDRGLSKDRFRSSSSLNRDTRDNFRPSSPGRDRYSLDRTAGYKDGPNSDSRRPVRSPRSRDRSPREYDKTSLHSSGSRRPLSPRSSPRRRSSLSPSPRFRRDRSRSPRSSSPSRRSRSPRKRSFSPGIGIGLAPYGSPIPSLSGGTTQRSPDRNGFKSPGGDLTPVKDGNLSPMKEDILDNVSDISEGDIPDVPEPEVEEEPETMDVVDNNFEDETLSTIRSSIAREDVEEISDEEAEWSDDVETGGFSDYEMDLGEDWEDPIKYFDISDVQLTPLTTYIDPTETIYECVKLNKIVHVASERTLVDTIDALEHSDVDDKFVENIEHVAKVVQYELHSCESDSVIRKLVKIAFISINFENAMDQLKPTFKVRHIKSGLKLVMELLSCGDSVSAALLSANLQAQLLSLYTKEHMAMSIKLLILRTLDCTLNTMHGIKLFSGRCLYSRLLELSNGSQSTRTQFSFSSILTKLHLSELLEQLVTVTSDTSDDNSEVVSDIIEQLTQIYKDLNLRMSQPARFLPSQSHFELAGKQFGFPQTGYFCLVSAYGVLELLAFLVTSPTTSDKEELTSAVHNLVGAWLEDQSGLLYLANRTQQTNILARALLGVKVGEGKVTETEETGEMVDDLDEGATTNLLLGSTLVHMVQAVRYLDIIQYDISRAETVRKDMETREVHNAIISLYGMTFTSKGREALVAVLTTGDHLDCLLTLIKHSSEEGKKDMKKSAIRGFASELLLLTIRTTDNVEFLQRYAGKLVELGKYDSHSKLAELVSWCNPLTDNTVFTEGGVVELTEVVKRNIEQVEEREQTKEGTLANELVTAVRILCHLVSAPRDRTQPRSASSQISEQMKYKYAAISMFSCDLVQHYTALLLRISLDHEQPHLHTATFVGNRGQTIISVIQPVIATLRRILEFVISCRDTEFRDLTVVGALLRTHTLLAVVPTTSVYYAQARATSLELVQCLLAFTQPNVDLAKNNVGKSLWSQMMLEVINYVVSSPCAYMPGLSLLSELLPLPLPLPSPRQLRPPEELSLSTCRKLWSAHLHPLSASLSKMVGVLACYSYPALLFTLQKVVEQLASLAPPTALVVVTAVLDTIHQLQADIAHSSVISRLAMFLSWCLAQPSMKTVLCDKLTDINYRTMVLSTLETVLGGDSPAPEHTVQAIHSLCDPRVTLRTETVSDKDSVLADSLPTRDSLSAFVCLLLDHLGTDSKNFSAHSLTVTTLTMLTEQECTLAILKNSLLSNNPSKERPLHSFLRKLAVEFSVSNPELLTCITSILSLLASLVDQGSQCNGGTRVPSSTTLTLMELGVCVSWVSGEDTQPQAAERRRTHPLVVLNNRVKEAGAEHSEMQLTRTSAKLGEVVSLLESLPADTVVPTSLSLSPLPSMVEPSTPIQLWSGQAVTVPAGDIAEEQLSLGYWVQSLQGMETQEQENSHKEELVSLDLLGISQKYLGTLDLYSVTREVTKERTLATERKKKGVKKSLMETKALHNKNIISAFKDGRNVSIRGRGFARSAFRPDPFRTRPPNTSRPPSLHVDDFLVLELKGQQPTGPTGYNKQSIKAAKELFAQREAEAALKPPALLREATREPVGQFSRGRGRGERGGRAFRGSNGSNRSFRRDSRGWSPEGFRTSEPRDLGRDARPGPREGDRRGGRGGGGFRGDRRGGGQWGDRGGGGRGERRFGRGGRGGDREDRPRHLRSLTR